MLYVKFAHAKKGQEEKECREMQWKADEDAAQEEQAKKRHEEQEELKARW